MFASTISPETIIIHPQKLRHQLLSPFIPDMLHICFYTTDNFFKLHIHVYLSLSTHLYVVYTFANAAINK
jgi:hypothetical protein